MNKLFYFLSAILVACVILVITVPGEKRMQKALCDRYQEYKAISMVASILPDDQVNQVLPEITRYENHIFYATIDYPGGGNIVGCLGFIFF